MATTIGILSLGDMGAGIARLLIANKYRVVTNVSDRRSVCIRALFKTGKLTMSTVKQHSFEHGTQASSSCRQTRK